LAGTKRFDIRLAFNHNISGTIQSYIFQLINSVAHMLHKEPYMT
jgi:hypothetical protein